MNKILKGILLGAAVGIIDVIPMIIQNLPWSANLSAFALWVVAGFLISTSNLKMPFVLKGILISLLLLAICAPLIGWEIVLVPILPINIALGALLGWIIGKFEKKK